MLNRQDVIETFFAFNSNAAAQRPNEHNNYNATARSAFAEHVDQLERAGQISEDLAYDITLSDDEQIGDTDKLTTNERETLEMLLMHIDRDDIAGAETKEIVAELEVAAAYENTQQIGAYVTNLIKKKAIEIYTMDVNGREMKFFDRGANIEQFEA